MKLRLCVVMALMCSAALSRAQILYPSLQGDDLLLAIQQDYTPNLPLSYAQARDTLYANIDVQADSIHAIYTDFSVYLPSNQDPTAALFAAGINTEHIYPQARGATDGTPPHRNMHHLAPARVDVNQARGNLHFAEIPDNQTDTWYREGVSQSTIPTINIDEYSEVTNTAFEPRESVKGDVARAVFYIHAIYRDQVESVDPVFFEVQRADLCAWHYMDPADDVEKARSQQIAQYQEGKENPFVIDCSVAERIYCTEYDDCFSSTLSPAQMQHVHVAYHSATNQVVLLGDLSDVADMTIYSIDGKKQLAVPLNSSVHGEHRITFNGIHGLYTAIISFQNGVQQYAYFVIL